MAKQDVLDAINSTIVQNDIKAITAQSLNNVLTMMVENAGEGGGSGDGAMRVIVPELMMFGPEFITIGEFSLTSWAEVKTMVEANEEGIDMSAYDAAVKASLEYNANVAQQILAKAKAGQGVSVVLDQTPYIPIVFSIEFQMMPQIAALYEDFAACVVQPAALFMEYAKLTPEGETATGLVGEQLMCILNPTSPTTLDEAGVFYPSNMGIVLNLDGSLTFEVTEEEQPSSGSGVGALRVWINEENTPEQIAENVSTYEALVQDVSKSVILMNAEETMTASFNPVATIVVNESTPMVQFGFIPSSIDGAVALSTCVLFADGSIAVD